MKSREAVRRLALKLGATEGEALSIADGLRDIVEAEIQRMRRSCLEEIDGRLDAIRSWSREALLVLASSETVAPGSRLEIMRLSHNINALACGADELIGEETKRLGVSL